MDFGSLLHAAQKNAKEAKTESKYYSTKFAPPKKETKEKKLSANIQRFLAKKEEEEREKARIAKLKRDELLAKRDPKLQKKINKMLKTIKSANKSVLEDAVDHQNTAITLAGPQQCDDDDYGYVSQESSALYAQIMQKYTSHPEEKKFPDARGKPADISSTKARVRDALNRAQEEENAPHQRKPRQSKGPRTATSSSEPYVGWGDRNKVEEKVEQEKPKKKNRPPPPPAMDFQQLLALAAQKQHEPVQVEAPVVKKEPERPLTKKQREELEERRAIAEAKAARMKGLPPPGAKKPTPASSSAMPPPKSNKVSKASRDPPPSNNTTLPKATSTHRIPSKSPASSKPLPSSSAAPKGRPTVPAKSSTESPRLMSALTDASRPKIAQPVANTRPVTKPSNVPSKSRELPQTAVRPTDKGRPDVRREAPERPQVSGSMGKSRPFPPPDHRFRDQRPVQKKVPKKRPVIEDDSSEYDSEMDDFIDDGDADEDYSSHIKSIFGYDRSRYRDEDFDDRQMESNFAQVMREEFVSKKIGMMEDLEDMRMEEEEKKRKAKRKKMAGK